ncbi:hypothetical protein AYI70_g10312 [Smittium culicis]|uniref:Uncharacterized protein n=1 Tax=Smittium culicis TaxID=133412 RepID=A0A1R1X758_9FUNG|nr:hypothetical protein AYI70_g10312 [Smittium culicis]
MRRVKKVKSTIPENNRLVGLASLTLSENNLIDSENVINSEREKIENDKYLDLEHDKDTADILEFQTHPK